MYFHAFDHRTGRGAPRATSLLLIARQVGLPYEGLNFGLTDDRVAPHFKIFFTESRASFYARFGALCVMANGDWTVICAGTLEEASPLVDAINTLPDVPGSRALPAVQKLLELASVNIGQIARATSPDDLAEVVRLSRRFGAVGPIFLGFLGFFSVFGF